MTTQIISMIFSIVASIVATVLGFILKTKLDENKRLKREKEDLDEKHKNAVKNGLVCILRKHLMDEHEVWTRKGYITSHALESGLLMYRAYKDLGGNGMIDHMEEEIQELDIRDN